MYFYSWGNPNISLSERIKMEVYGGTLTRNNGLNVRAKVHEIQFSKSKWQIEQSTT